MGLKDDAPPFRAADIGCADGGTSVGMWTPRARPRARPPFRAGRSRCSTADLPRNDFSQLFRMIHGQTDIQSYYGQIPDVYPFASGTSFHQAIFPPGSLDLAFSATASHYISKVPCNISDHVHMVGASGEERRAYEETGRVEWERLLALRARELVKGGRPVLLQFRHRRAGPLSRPHRRRQHVRHLQPPLARPRRRRHHHAAEYTNTNFPQVYRTSEQFTAPLRDPSSAGPSGRACGSSMSRSATSYALTPGPSPSMAMPPASPATTFPTLRSWTEPTFASGLSAQRPPEERARILDEFFGRYERLVAQSRRAMAWTTSTSISSA